MKQVIRTVLNDQEIKAINSLIKKCQAYDKTFKEPYLSNMLNFDSQLPSFFLGYEQEKLVAFLGVYADSKEAELSLLVEPDYRRQGYATALYDSFNRETKNYQLEPPLFITEAKFLTSNPDFLTNLQLHRLEDTEILLGRNSEPFDVTPKEEWQVKQAAFSDVDAIVAVKMSAFDDETREIHYQYVTEAIGDDDSLLYILSEENKVLASCTVNISNKDYYLYGLAVLEAYRGKGIGSYLVMMMINDLIQKGAKSFQIAVDDDNVGARRLYEKLGFTYQTQVVYLTEKQD
ncbi:GNAT family N-acetyltransferase [Streptococcus pacificus]|uniref:GNAT family N-acetyltransferase n=1 Tax=Streptococcus pacificus TaxID=2740577 RepID=A0ABS0ZK45_9STRE|nr:GNAT family N-acetyltransferase [Streptococcus pacificus]MBJ8326309.1 GNAT family N-acetyltransferase [Streptococcus pacificus]